MRTPKPVDSTQQQKIGSIIHQYQTGHIKRRDFLRRMVAIGVSTSAAYATLGKTVASAQQKMTTGAVGEEGLSQPKPRPTTFAVGEETTPPTLNNPRTNPRPTTFAVGEEGSPPMPQATTLALGEEGQAGIQRPAGRVGKEFPSSPFNGLNSNPTPTTFAVGEEGSHPNIRPTTHVVGEESQATPTTHLVGEEDANPTNPFRHESPSQPRQNQTVIPHVEPVLRWRRWRRW